MASISKEYYQILLSQGVCSAIGVSIIFQPGKSQPNMSKEDTGNLNEMTAINVIPSWFNRKSGAAYGITTSGSSIGGVIFPIMIDKLIAEVGYGWAMRISAFLILFLLVIANLTIRSSLPPNTRSLSRDGLLQPFRETKMVLVIAGFVLLTFGVFVPIDYLAVEAISKGMSPDLAQYLIAILNAGRYV